MKKFLSIISLMLAMLLMLAVPAFAEETEAEEPFELPEGIRKIYANDITGTIPVIDGVINENEYGKISIRVEDPSEMESDTRIFQKEPHEKSNASEYMDFYFAYDENNIYIAIYDAGPECVDDGDEFTWDNGPYRSNYCFRMGFQLEDMTSDFRFAGYGTNTSWAQLTYHEFGPINEAPIKTADLVRECIVRKVDVETGEDVAYGDLLTANGNVNHPGKKWEMYTEMKLAKQDIVDALNACFYTEYEEIPNAMYFDFLTYTGRTLDDTYDTFDYDCGTWYNWIGDNNVAGKQGNYTAFGYYDGMSFETIFDLIVFGDENTVIAPTNPFPEGADTENEDTEPEATDAPVTDAPKTEAPATEAPVTETPDESGCGAAVSLAGIALVATLGTCTVFVSKKKED